MSASYLSLQKRPCSLDPWRQQVSHTADCTDRRTETEETQKLRFLSDENKICPDEEVTEHCCHKN